MQPIERLRTVARAEGAAAPGLVAEAASALAALTGDPRALVTAGRRLTERQPSCGPLWWLAARVLTSLEPRAAAVAAVDDVHRDPTAGRLAASAAGDITVTLVGSGGSGAAAVSRRLDLRVLVADVDDDAYGLVSRLGREGSQATLVAAPALGAAVVRSDLLLVECSAAGPSGFAAPAGALAACAVASHAGVPSWIVAGVGTMLPGPLWETLRALVERAEWPGNDFAADQADVVPWTLASQVARPGGLSAPGEAVARPDCAPAPELVRAGERLRPYGSTGSALDG